MPARKSKQGDIIMRMFICLLVAIIMAQACYSQETNIRIRGYHDGELTFNQISNAAYYRVDWAPKADGPWSQSWSKFQAVPPTTNDAITLSLPKFYRVTAILQGSLSGLIAHYAFDEDAGVRIPDKACPGNYGDLHGATWVGTNGIGGAYSFDGIDDYIELGSSDLYQRQGQLSGCGWINRKSRHMLLLTNYRGGSAYNGQFVFGIDSAGSLSANFG